MVIDYLVNVSLEIIRCYLSYLGGKKAGNRIPGNWAIWYEKFYFYSLSKIVPTKKKSASIFRQNEPIWELVWLPISSYNPISDEFFVTKSWSEMFWTNQTAGLIYEQYYLT